MVDRELTLNLQALTERAANGEVHELEPLSLEGDFIWHTSGSIRANSLCWTN